MFLNRCAVEFYLVCRQILKFQRKYAKTAIFLSSFWSLFTLRCAAKLVYKNSVPQAQKRLRTTGLMDLFFFQIKRTVGHGKNYRLRKLSPRCRQSETKITVKHSFDLVKVRTSIFVSPLNFFSIWKITKC